MPRQQGNFVDTTNARTWTFRAIPLLVLVATAMLLAVNFQHADGQKAPAFESLVLSLEDRTRSELERLFGPISTQMSIATGRLKSQPLPLDNPTALTEGFLPLLQELPQISSVQLADSDGREYMILRTENGWLIRKIDVSKQPGQARWQRVTSDGEASEAWDESLEYDPRQRPWFRGTVDTGAPYQLFWTEPYRFVTTKTPGITASTSWPAAADANKDGLLDIDFAC